MLRWAAALLLVGLGVTALGLFVIVLAYRLAVGDFIGTLASPPHVLGIPMGGIYPILLPLGAVLLIAAAYVIAQAGSDVASPARRMVGSASRALGVVQGNLWSLTGQALARTLPRMAEEREVSAGEPCAPEPSAWPPAPSATAANPVPLPRVVAVLRDSRSGGCRLTPSTSRWHRRVAVHPAPAPLRRWTAVAR